MAVISSFSEETLKNVFKNNLKLNKQQNVKYFVEQCRRNENLLCLKVVLENEDLDMGHFMIKILGTGDISKIKSEYAESLENVFTVQDDNKDVYLGFAKKGTLYPFKNNLENLHTVLKSLAEFQANNLAKTTSETIITSEYKVKNISDAVVSLEFFKDVDKVHISDAISRLQKSVDELFRDGLSVKSIGSIFANNVFITASDKCVFLDLGQEEIKSPVFDALIFIFAFSDENFRQHHLKKLLSLYYQTFIEFAKKIDKNLAVNFDLNVFEGHVKILLPIVKFETAAYLIQKGKTHQENQYLEELLKNILYSLKYHQISYEDCLEAVSKKIGSTEFSLLNYQLIPLDQKNGHLGEYFTLQSKVIFSGKTEKFNMFTKVLFSSNAHMNEIVQSGASKKEQFFFRTLMPLFKQYGLESLVDFAPNCYFDRLNDVIILDNLVELGYKSFKTDTRIGYDVLKLAFLKVAKLHAASLILEDRMSKSKGAKVRLGDIYKEFMEDWVFEIREGLPKNPVNGADSKPGLDQLIDSFEDVIQDISKEEFHKRVDAIYEVFLKRINTPAEQFRNVVCHGDLYASNILIKYNQNGMADNCFMVDFQALRYAPIAEDILILGYYSTNKEVRGKYLDTLLEEYYQELTKIMVQFNLNINTFYTPQEFRESVKYMRPIIILGAIFYGQIIALSPERREEIFYDDSNFKYYFFENRKEYIKYLLSFNDDCAIYLKGLIEDLYDLCVNGDFI